MDPLESPALRCPVREDDGSECRQRVRVTVTVGEVFGVECYLDVCIWHAEVIEGDPLSSAVPAGNVHHTRTARYR